MSGEVPIEIEDKPTAVGMMRELVVRLQDTIEALKREIARNRKSDEYRKALKDTEARLTIAKRVKRQEHRTHHKGSNIISLSVFACEQISWREFDNASRHRLPCDGLTASARRATRARPPTAVWRL
jgi:hypothetical protein